MHAFAIFSLICIATAYPSGQANVSPNPCLATRWSAFLIRTIFGSPPKDPAVFVPVQLREYPSQANYKEDVVLRFNISSEEEAKALSSATNALFLDVWESNREWADIRVAKDVVSFVVETVVKC